MLQTSIKLKFRPSSSEGKQGTLYLQLILNRKVRQVGLGCHIYETEWNPASGEIVDCQADSADRCKELNMIRNKVECEIHKLAIVASEDESSFDKPNLDAIVERYQNLEPVTVTVFGFMREQIELLRAKGKYRSRETYSSALNSFMRFRDGADLYFDMVSADVMELYEAYLRGCNISRNTSSFYMRILRAVYNQAVEEGLTKQAEPFRRVYTGVDRTSKRAIDFRQLKQLKDVDLLGERGLVFARDMFLFSFYMRGMSFVDMAYLRKKDLKDGYLTYSRQKTRQKLYIRWEAKMQELLDKYGDTRTPYLLPILKDAGDELRARRQYISMEQYVNRKLKQIGLKINIGTKLTMYVARHSWASIAQDKNIPLPVISRGMGHDSEHTTQIYLASIQTARIDKANNEILKDL